MMEYLEGAALSAVIKGRGPLPLGSLARAACEVLDALSAAHRQGIVHRDLKPDNIIITRKGRAKVLDFGTAKLMPTVDMTQVQTQTGHVLGTPSYMAPEQILPEKPIDHRTDIYAMGALLYHAATGRKPFDAPYLYDVLRMQLTQQPQPPRTLRPDLPPAYEAVIMTAMAKEPEQRFQSAYDMGQALNNAVIGLVGNAWDSLSATPDERHITLAPGQRMSGQQPAAQPPLREATVSGQQPVVQQPRTVRTAVIAIAAALVGAILMAVLIGDSDQGSGQETSKDSGVVVLDAAVPTPTPDAANRGGPDEIDGKPPDKPPVDSKVAETLLDGVDLAKFDPLQYRVRADAEAQKVYEDAALVRLKVFPVAVDGAVDLTSDPKAEVVYSYRSPKRSKDGEPCGYRVKITWNTSAQSAKASAMATQGGGCDEPILKKTSCTLPQVWKKAIGRGAPEDRGPARMELWMSDKKKRKWSVQVGSGSDVFRRDLRDSCSN